MQISRIAIKNFRNFESLDIPLGPHAVIVGANGVGKSNLLHALRLVLDPSLPDSQRLLRDEDFWEGIPRPLTKDARIEMLVELTDFDADLDQKAILGGYLVDPDTMTARMTYVFRARPDLSADKPLLAQFEFIVFGGEDEDNRCRFDDRRRMPLEIIYALRDAEADLAAWRRSPLRPLLERAWRNISDGDKETVAKGIDTATANLSSIGPITSLESEINAIITKFADDGRPLDLKLGVAPTDPDELVRAVRLLVGGVRGIGDVSLGSANVIYIGLKILELRQLVADHERDHTFIAIEEPEAHLHPHLQRQVFRGFLRLRPHLHKGTETPLEASPATILLTTHSPHLASISPLKNIVLLRRIKTKNPSGADVVATIGSSTAGISLEKKVVDDLERYLEATRGEMLFARGVILVEGEAELYLVPKIAELHGFPLDRYGITVCAVGGTHFTSHAKLLNALGIPFCIITDGDPDENGNKRGVARAVKLCDELLGLKLVPSAPNIVAQLGRFGVFVGDKTFEIDIFDSGRNASVPQALAELATTGAAGTRAQQWSQSGATIDRDQMLKDILSIGKGRFAQRLATLLQFLRPRGGRGRRLQGPKYIIDAIDHIVRSL
jgi:putative ATP-dependent endonuclease of OLD family